MMMPDYWYEFKKDVKPAAGVSRDVDELEKIVSFLVVFRRKTLIFV